jgi:hypothetical protein
MDMERTRMMLLTLAMVVVSTGCSSQRIVSKSYDPNNHAAEIKRRITPFSSTEEIVLDNTAGTDRCTALRTAHNQQNGCAYNDALEWCRGQQEYHTLLGYMAGVGYGAYGFGGVPAYGPVLGYGTMNDVNSLQPPRGCETREESALRLERLRMQVEGARLDLERKRQSLRLPPSPPVTILVPPPAPPTQPPIIIAPTLPDHTTEFMPRFQKNPPPVPKEPPADTAPPGACMSWCSNKNHWDSCSPECRGRGGELPLPPGTVQPLIPVPTPQPTN